MLQNQPAANQPAERKADRSKRTMATELAFLETPKANGRDALGEEDGNFAATSLSPLTSRFMLPNVVSECKECTHTHARTSHTTHTTQSHNTVTQRSHTSTQAQSTHTHTSIQINTPLHSKCRCASPTSFRPSFHRSPTATVVCLATFAYERLPTPPGWPCHCLMCCCWLVGSSMLHASGQPGSILRGQLVPALQRSRPRHPLRQGDNDPRLHLPGRQRRRR